MDIKPLPPYYPTFKQTDKLTNKHQYFAKMMYNKSNSAGKASQISSNIPVILKGENK